jgi:hypothetical protein
MAGFWDSMGNWFGNALGINQANAAQQARGQEQQAVQSQQNLGTNMASGAGSALGYTQAGLGANPGQTVQNSLNAAMPAAKSIAAQTGNVAGRQTLSAARTAGLNKGQAALEGGQAGGNAAAAAMPGAIGQEQGVYMGGLNTGAGLSTGLGSVAAGALGSAGSTAAGMAGEQGKQGMQGFQQTAGGILSGAGSGAVGMGAPAFLRALKKGGITEGPSLAGEAGPEAVIPIHKLLRAKPRAVKEVLKVIKPQLEAQAAASPDIAALIQRIEALEGKKPEANAP